MTKFIDSKLSLLIQNSARVLLFSALEKSLKIVDIRFAGFQVILPNL